MHNKKRWTYPSLACNLNKAYGNMLVLFSNEHIVCVCVCVCVCTASRLTATMFMFFPPSLLSIFTFFLYSITKNYKLQYVFAICNINVIIYFYRYFSFIAFLPKYSSFLYWWLFIHCLSKFV